MKKILLAPVSNRFPLVRLLPLVLLLASACSVESPGPVEPDQTAMGSDGKASVQVVIYSVNYPLAWVAQELVGESAQVVFPAPEGEDPAFWRPDAETVVGFQGADLILLNGADYARWISQVSLPHSRLLDTSAGLDTPLIHVDSGPMHSHGPGGEHSHGELAFTLWLDLEIFAHQLRVVAAALQGLLPAEAELIQEREEAMLLEIADLDSDLRELAKQLAGAPVFYSHPVYQYLQRAYGLNGRAMHWEPGQDPGAEGWSEFDHLLGHHRGHLMFWEDEPLSEVRAALAERGVEIVVFRPMGNRPDSGDFLTGMRENVHNLANYLKP